MSLATKVHSSFWTDEDVQNLTPKQKLAALWVLTSRDTSNLGLLKVARRVFEFDTGMSMEVLEGACKGLARSFVTKQDPGGFRVLALNFIAYQFGDAVNLTRNNVHRHLVNLLLNAEPWVQKALTSRYEGLARSFETAKSLDSPLQGASSPSKGLRSPQSRAEPSSAEQSRASKGGVGGGFEGGGAHIPSDGEVLAFAKKWPGELESGAPGPIPEAFAVEWLGKMNGRTLGWPLQWERALVADWRKEWRAGWRKNGRAGSHPIELRTRLALVTKKIAEHPANEESAAHLGEVSAEEEREYQRLVKEKGEIEKELSK